MHIFTALLALPSLGLAYPYFNQDGEVKPETRSLDELHKAALAEGGIVTLWHGGDEKNQQNLLKSEFEKQFPGVTLNLTVNLSKVWDIRLDEQLVNGDLTVDVAMLQTLHDFPRWKKQGALAAYKPADFESVFNQIRDPDGYYMGVSFYYWPLTWDASTLYGAGPTEYTDFLKPEFKDKLVLTYPNDDDAVLFAFDQIIKQYGVAWFDALLSQNPRWVRGSQTPTTIILGSNGTKTATFAAFGPLASMGDLRGVLPTQGRFTSWAQTGAIFACAPHPAAARLLMNFILGRQWQQMLVEFSWSVREDMPLPTGFDKSLMNMTNTDPLAFHDFMMDRPTVESTRFWFEDRIGTAQGLSPLIDGI